MRVLILRGLMFAMLTLAVSIGTVFANPLEDASIAYQRGDYGTALRIWRPLADQGNAEAQSNLGFMYEKGNGVAQDFKEAVRLCRTCGSPCASARRYRIAAHQGFATAQFLLGMMYLRGEGLAQDYEEALRLLLIAAKQGNEGAQNDLGVMYRDGIGVARDYKEAMKWYRLAAEKNYATAQYNISSMYAEGLGVTQDFARAYMWVTLAAAQNNPNAMKYQRYHFKAYDRAADRRSAGDGTKVSGIELQTVRLSRGCGRVDADIKM